MKERDRVAIGALRSALGALSNSEAVDAQHESTSSGGPIAGAVSGLGAGEAPRRELSDGDEMAVLAAEIAERRGAADEYERLGQSADAARLRAEVVVLSGFYSVDDASPEAT